VTRSEIYVNDALESFGRMWVKMQGVDMAASVPYCLRIASVDLDLIAEPGDKDPSTSWDRYLRELVDEGGSLILSTCLANLRQRSGVSMEPSRWVIATLDEVVEDAHSIELHGRAVKFDPIKFWG
jgi:hypothetical protein